MMQKVTILIPCYNEELAIAKVINDVKNIMSDAPYDYEILVVDDNSTDDTARIAEASGARVIRRVINGGSGAARKTGILNAQGDIIVMLDGDGSYSASDIPRMLIYFPQYDQINGVRMSEQGSIKWLRIPAKWFIKKLASYLVSSPILDLNTGLKAFKKDIMLKFMWMIPDGFSCVTTMTLAFLVNGYAVKYIRAQYYKRIGQSKFHPVKDTYNYLQTIFRIIMYFNPLKIFFPLSLLIFIFGVIKTIYDRYFFIHRMQLSDIVILLVSVIIWVLGLIADLIVAQGKALVYFNELRKPN